jgi:hypothetical protein
MVTINVPRSTSPLEICSRLHSAGTDELMNFTLNVSGPPLRGPADGELGPRDVPQGLAAV